jgi:hypothetical protein
MPLRHGLCHCTKKTDSVELGSRRPTVPKQLKFSTPYGSTELTAVSEEPATSHYFELDEAIPRPHPIYYHNYQLQGTGL